MKARVITPILGMKETYLAGSIIDVERANKHTFRMGDRYVSSADLELLEPENNIDWEQRRYNLAKEVMITLIDKEFGYAENINKAIDGVGDLSKFHSSLAVKYADALIEELRKEE